MQWDGLKGGEACIVPELELSARQDDPKVPVIADKCDEREQCAEAATVLVHQVGKRIELVDQENDRPFSRETNEAAVQWFRYSCFSIEVSKGRHPTRKSIRLDREEGYSPRCKLPAELCE